MRRVGAYDSDELTKAIVAEFISNSSLPVADLGTLIGAVHAAVVKLNEAASDTKEASSDLAAFAEKSITQEYLVCLEDGRKFKSLTRHLSALGMTPDEYRTKWGLPPDYPMVAPSLSKKLARNSPRINLEKAEIIARISEWAGGKEKAQEWYRGQPLAAFGDRTPESLVKSGQAEALRDYLDSIALGGFA